MQSTFSNNKYVGKDCRLKDFFNTFQYFHWIMHSLTKKADDKHWSRDRYKFNTFKNTLVFSIEDQK